VTVVDWDRYRACGGCGAPLAGPCVSLSGYVEGAGYVEVAAEMPCSTRKLRAAAARAGGDR
jgi:hypothetical protein